MAREDTVERLYAAIKRTRPLLRDVTASVALSLEGTGLSVGQRAVLDVLRERRSATAPQITESIEVKRQYVAKLLLELRDLGLVSTIPNPRHKRALIYGLTPRGAALMARIRATELEITEAVSEDFSDAALLTFCRVQEALCDGFSARVTEARNAKE